MKRRNFTQSLFATAGLSSLPICVSFAAKAPLHELQKSQEVCTAEGLNLLLKKQVNPMKNNDRKQFILTYEVDNNKKPLEEKIYDVTIAGGKSHQIYMTPIADNLLQAVFNWRLNA